MRGYLILMCFALLLSACTVTVKNPGASLGGSAEGGSGQTVFGTLCVGPIDCAAAPTMTRIAMLRKKAAADLRRERISIDVAKAVLADTERMMDDLMRAADAGNATGVGKIGKEADTYIKIYEASLNEN